MNKILIDEQMIQEDFFEKLKEDMMPFKIMMAKYKCALMEVETKFKVLNEEFSLKYNYNPIESIKTRLKSPESIFGKVKKKEITASIASIQENIKDIAGIRVTCSFIEDIYIIKKCLTEQDDIKIFLEKDYIKNPKPNGYRSLHLIVEVPIFLQNEKVDVQVEVQLRTIAMDFWASLEHKVKYKKNIPEKLECKFQEELLECAEASNQLDMKMERIKNRLFEIK